MVRLTEATGVYTWLAIRAGQWSQGRPALVVLALGGTTAVLSAFLDNVTTVLLIVPITFLLADALDVDPMPLIVIEIFASNIGGTATLIGDPPNILIAGHTGLSFMAFITNLAPIVLVTLAVVGVGLYLRYRGRLHVTDEARERVMGLDARRSIEDPAEAQRTIPILLATILGFFFHKTLGLEPATVALSGAAIMLLVTRQPLQETIGGIEWATLFFLLGPVRHGRRAGAHRRAQAGRRRHRLGHGRRPHRRAAGHPVGVRARLGARRQHPVHGGDAARGRRPRRLRDDSYWWALSLGACFGGNLTLVAAAANVAASGMAARAGRPIGFLTFLKVGAPVTAVSLVLATGYVLLRYG